METVILDASAAGDSRTRAAADALERALEARGSRVERIVVRELDVRPCTGCFGCWTRTPGQCVIADDARSIAERVIAAKAFALVTPVSFGSYGSLAKSVMDRLICLILPHFTLVDGEVHHARRYARYPRFVALGTLDAPSAESGAIFERLVERNSVNLHSPAHAAEIVVGDADAGLVAERLLERAGMKAEVFA